MRGFERKLQVVYLVRLLNAWNVVIIIADNESIVDSKINDNWYKQERTQSLAFHCFGKDKQLANQARF